MRVVISHFFNEEYLLPWWLQHHVPMFDYGIMINHSSTDSSVELIKKYAPNWRIVNSRLTEFDSALTDLEVSNFETELPPGSWKIALNTTEFLVPSKPLEAIERALLDAGRVGCSCSGVVIVDGDPENVPVYYKPLVLQKFWGIEDNIISDKEPGGEDRRLDLGLDRYILRNRFYHSNVVGMYGPGRHNSFHPDFGFRSEDLFIFYYSFSPWTEETVKRKTQIKNRLKPADVARGWGTHHTFSPQEWEKEYKHIFSNARSLSSNANIATALRMLKEKYPKGGYDSAENLSANIRLSITEQMDFARMLHAEREHSARLQHEVNTLQRERVANTGSRVLLRTLLGRATRKLRLNR